MMRCLIYVDIVCIRVFSIDISYFGVVYLSTLQQLKIFSYCLGHSLFLRNFGILQHLRTKELFAFLCLSDGVRYNYGVYVVSLVRGPL